MSKVQLTSALTSQLVLAGLDPAILIEQFAQWKQKGEYSSYFFGKDGFNRDSTLLRHVHMVPLHDPAEAAQRKQPGSGVGGEPVTVICFTPMAVVATAIY